MSSESASPATEWSDELLAEIGQQISRYLSSRRGSVFMSRGVEATAQLVTRLLQMLKKDAAAGGSELLRTELRSVVGTVSSEPISYRDLRLLSSQLRSVVLKCVEQKGASKAVSQHAADWCHELALQCGLLLISWREEIIERQALELEAKLAEQRQLSIPIAPVYEGVLVVPIVGSLDSYRSQILTERVLNEISATRAQFVLLDISGVPSFDQDVARSLLKVTAATKLLGTELVLVGISAATTQVIITLDVDLGDLVTLRNLQDGLAYALTRLNRQIVPLQAPAKDKPARATPGRSILPPRRDTR
ncbi:MAG: STAS domain-containing protein [Polyangia bacterium]